MISIELQEYIVKLKTTYTDKDKCASIPGGRWNPKSRTWDYLLTPATASSMLQAFPNEVSEKDKDLLYSLSSRLTMARAIVNETKELGCIPRTMIEPWHHQLVAYNMAVELFGLENGSEKGGGALLALDMGTGKSKVTVDLICNYPKQFRKVLVICPASVIDVWSGNEAIKGQFEIHATESAYRNLLIVPSKRKDSVEKKTKRAEMMRLNAYNQDKQLIVVINYESAWREPFATWAHAVNFDLVVGDEIHRIKSPGGKTSKFFARLAHNSKNHLGLTGTPLPHSPLDAYGQYRFLDPGIFGTSFSRFRANYAVMGGFEGRQAVAYKNTDMLHDKMFLIAHRVMASDVHDLPEFIPMTRTCELSKEEMRIYKQMDEDFCVEVNNDIVTAANALVKLLRLQEITSGYLDGKQIGTSKSELLADVLEDFDQKEPIVIFARFTNDLKMIREVAASQNRRYAELSGHDNQLGLWQAGNADVLGVQIKSGSVGVDFTRARYSIYYSLGFSLGDYDQSRKRLDRYGQTRQGMYIHLLCDNTVDFKVMKALEMRQEVVASVLNQYKEIP